MSTMGGGREERWLICIRRLVRAWIKGQRVKGSDVNQPKPDRTVDCSPPVDPPKEKGSLKKNRSEHGSEPGDLCKRSDLRGRKTEREP